jgi:hypothetical protein
LVIDWRKQLRPQWRSRMVRLDAGGTRTAVGIVERGRATTCATDLHKPR